MKTLYPALLLLFAFTIIGSCLQAQSPDTSAAAHDSTTATGNPAKPHHHSHFLAEVSYQSNNVYMGRKDSEALQYYMPSITYEHKSGMYFSASAAYLDNSTESRIDVFTLEGGYAFDAGIYSGDFTATKYFYNSQSTSVTSGITFSMSYRNELDLGFITPSLTTGLDFGPTTDVNGSFGLEHEFEACNDKLRITPTFMANASTLNFYDSYFQQRRFKKRSGTKIITGTEKITGTVQDAGTFRMLDYEASLPLSYTVRKFTFSFTPTYAIPVNPAIVDVHTVYSTGSVSNKKTVEKLGNTFFWTLGVRCKF
ncbi:hypothetical protein [Puia dinghuensis]|uniref:DUF3078 domain-containing protein n=1 Tax=Puia dinghuensis TaxID=1792502 RepID=A0A8J2UC61_9BACT|nr:hypothetical protein [Puia dinghuensis]GGA97312.1 hypothetical protein GCM10011511_20820 [Puia dinghuensis]